MKLASYLKRHELTAAEFAALADVSKSTVSRLLSVQRLPSTAMVKRIHALTRGAVSLKDWDDVVRQPESTGA